MMGVDSLPKTVTRQHRSCHLNPGPSAPESSTLTTRLPSHPVYYMNNVNISVTLLLLLCGQEYINEVVNDPWKSKLCRQRVLCRTLAGNLVYLLTITSPAAEPSEDTKVRLPFSQSTSHL